MSTQRTAIIIGAGPAGLTAAHELLAQTDVLPIVFEAGEIVGGLSQTVNYKGNRIDIGGHRFFSKADQVMQWWLKVLPLERVAGEGGDVTLTYQQQQRSMSAGEGPDPARTDRVMLLRSRLSRILYLRKFFDYPISLSVSTIANLGLWRTFKVGVSYLGARLRPIKQERSLEDFFINRFGRALYLTFFKSYTEKVWGLPCDQISPEWGAQRVKGLSISKAIAHALRSIFARDRSLNQKGTETSLIERFMYPKLGPGQLWETVAVGLVAGGASVRTRCKVVGVRRSGTRIIGVDVLDEASGRVESHDADFVFSTMPVRDLVAQLDRESPVPEAVRQVAQGLMYRDFITVGVLLKKLVARAPDGSAIRDNWIYVQEPDVKIGRIQLFNNWSPYMVRDPETSWIGLEYFCNEGDDLWRMSDGDFSTFAVGELEKIGLARAADVLDSVVIRVPKTYPAYFGSYEHFGTVREYLDTFTNLFLIGRNGMHRYNNQDHSMLTAMKAVENIRDGVTSKENIWAVNVEQEYHEERGEG
ncbi:MAG: NAD(P)/FAD-dependent oxidoreductase [Thermoflexales bacterium]|nr:NAD(P)/FAD-dependent oxidoreductase [Thermoflexales bacterium]